MTRHLARWLATIPRHRWWRALHFALILMTSHFQPTAFLTFTVGEGPSGEEVLGTVAESLRPELRVRLNRSFSLDTSSVKSHNRQVSSRFSPSTHQGEYPLSYFLWGEPPILYCFFLLFKAIHPFLAVRVVPLVCALRFSPLSIP